MVREAADKKANNIQARSLVARNMENMSDAAQRREQQKWAIEKPKFDTARKIHVYGSAECAQVGVVFTETHVGFAQQRVCLAQGSF